MKCFQKLTTDRNYAIGWGVLSFSAIAFFLCVLLIAGALVTFGQYRSQDDSYNTITVEGYAEIASVPDVATLSFSVTETSESLNSAQDESAKKVNAIMAYLEESDVDTEKDVATSNYRANPKYEWIRECTGYNCPGKNILVGYEVSQTISVKVRELDNAGTVLAEIGNKGATNISGLSFEIDDPTQLKADARVEAVADAKGKAKVLAEELDVKLDDVVSFYENGGGYEPYPVAYQAKSMAMDFAEEAAVAPVLPSGENTITSNVSITYRIK